MADEVSQCSPVQRLEFWIAFALRNAAQHERVAQELSKLLKIQETGACGEDVKIVLEFYANLQPRPFYSVVRSSPRLQSFVENSPPAVDRIMSQLLFENVTKSSTECVEYCVQIWLERIQSKLEPQHLVFHDLPNALEFLDPQSPTRQSEFPPSIYHHLNSILPDQRQDYVKKFRILFDCIPARFYPRTSIAFFIFLEFYRHMLGDNDHETENLLQELRLWMETLILLIGESLTKLASAQGSKSTGNMASMQQRMPLHHILSVLLMSTKAFSLIKTHSEISANFTKALGRLQSCSSGATRKWLQVLISEAKDEGIHSDSSS